MTGGPSSPRAICPTPARPSGVSRSSKCHRPDQKWAGAAVAGPSRPWPARVDPPLPTSPGPPRRADGQRGQPVPRSQPRQGRPRRPPRQRWASGRGATTGGFGPWCDDAGLRAAVRQRRTSGRGATTWSSEPHRNPSPRRDSRVQRPPLAPSDRGPAIGSDHPPVPSAAASGSQVFVTRGLRRSGRAGCRPKRLGLLSVERWAVDSVMGVDLGKSDLHSCDYHPDCGEC